MRNPAVPPPKPPPTFGMLRELAQGFCVKCHRCQHEVAVSSKASRFLRGRLPDELLLEDATRLFRCTQCNYNVVRLQPIDKPVYRD